jgi:hypothetical protein
VSLQINESVIWQETGDGISLYHTDSGEFRTLNDTGAKIWVLVESDGEREMVKSRLTLLFAGPNTAVGQRIHADVDNFIDSMIEQGLLSESTTA